MSLNNDLSTEVTPLRKPFEVDRSDPNFHRYKYVSLGK